MASDLCCKIGANGNLLFSWCSVFCAWLSRVKGLIYIACDTAVWPFPSRSFDQEDPARSGGGALREKGRCERGWTASVLRSGAASALHGISAKVRISSPCSSRPSTTAGVGIKAERCSRRLSPASTGLSSSGSCPQAVWSCPEWRLLKRTVPGWSKNSGAASRTLQLNYG